MRELKLVLNDAEEGEFRQMMEDMGLSSDKELLNNALTFLQWAVGERKKGRDIASLDRENRQYFTARLPALDEVADFPRPMGRA